jgi:AbrB family looped-hinge helix DNA binding protein
MTNVVGERFQITIDKAVRRQLGIKPGDRAIERVEEGRLVVTFTPAPHDRSLMGILNDPGLAPIEDWQAAKDRAWTTRGLEICYPGLGQAVIALLAKQNVVLADADMGGLVAAISRTLQVSARRIADAILAAAAEQSGCDWIATLDEGFSSPTIPTRLI